MLVMNLSCPPTQAHLPSSPAQPIHPLCLQAWVDDLVALEHSQQQNLDHLHDIRRQAEAQAAGKYGQPPGDPQHAAVVAQAAAASLLVPPPLPPATATRATACLLGTQAAQRYLHEKRLCSVNCHACRWNCSGEGSRAGG